MGRRSKRQRLAPARLAPRPSQHGVGSHSRSSWSRSNLARTNLLGDLIVAAANGSLLDQHEVARTLREASRRTRGWAPPPRARDGDVERLVTTALARATSNPSYLDLEVWFHGSFRRAADARRAAAARVSRTRKADPVRTPADIELRSPQSVHAFR